MTAHTTFRRLRVLASLALVGCAAVGTRLYFYPITAPFDLRSIGAVIGGGIAAIRDFHIV
ncbi:hypothetical protein [Caballeronia mineralivorans]|jgi:hypothetical protein|uniref:hypothetical protein n=1 Tax=Caballeronia mineralivorans TaxID=2010198 RepID=UPI0023F25AD0|nr:hypothetical protein [Caballeronia mineralivorans]